MELPMWRAAQLLCRVCLLLSTLAVSSRAAHSEGMEVDLALVLAVDVSYSMDPDEQELQRQGFVEAFRSAVVHDAIRRGALGRIAVVYMECIEPLRMWTG